MSLDHSPSRLPFILTEEQENSVIHLVGLIRKRLAESHSISQEEQFATSISQEEQFATLGLFGSSGSGKSTVLGEVCRRLLKRGQRQVDDESGRLFLCWPPLDYNTLSSEIPLGISVVEYIHRRIRERLGTHDNVVVPGERQSNWKTHEETPRDAEDEAWVRLLEQYVRTDKRHRQLEISLAVSPLEYQDIAQRELQSRGSLKQVIDPWLTVARKQVAADKILVPIEDCDLGQGGFDPTWITTFLEELSNPDIIFLLVADEEHLEKVLRKRAEKAAGIPVETVFKLLNKLVPVTHRVYLGRLGVRNALGFSFGDKPEPSLPPLKHYLERICGSRGMPPLVDLKLILPPYPRGLLSLYRGLGWAGDKEGGPTAKEFFSTADELIAFIARCRGENALARRLPLRPLDWWGSRFRWSLDGLSSTRWRQMVTETCSELPIAALEPEALPHDSIAAEDRAAWAEVLLNASLRKSHQDIRILIRRFITFKKYLDRCFFTYRPLPAELERLARRESGLLASPWLRLRGESANESIIEAGWAPLVEHDQEHSQSTLGHICADLAVPQPPAVATGGGRLLPPDVRSLVLLIDRMARLPWQELGSWAMAREIHEWFPMLRLLCAGAYLAALRDRLATEGDALTSKIPTFAPDPARLLKLSAKELDKEIRRLPQPTELIDIGRPLTDSASSFLSYAVELAA